MKSFVTDINSTKTKWFWNNSLNNTTYHNWYIEKTVKIFSQNASPQTGNNPNSYQMEKI